MSVAQRLQAVPCTRLVGESSGEEEALSSAARVDCDVLLQVCDTEYKPQESALLHASKNRDDRLQASLVLHANAGHRDQVQALLDYGARNIVGKRDDLGELVHAVLLTSGSARFRPA